ncbi:MAG: hypothetical protein J5585_09825 [Clostridia bacterium]|nr:hypothetical protein [Clostridia bacterium]
MRKMKIGIVIIGDRYSFSEEERKIENVDLNKADAINRAVDGELISSLSERIRALIPQEIETFTAHVITENDALDTPKADAYVAIPFAAHDLILTTLHSKNKPVVIYTAPYAELWSYGNVFYPYFMRDARKIDKMLGIDPDIHLCNSDEDLSEHISALYVRFRVRNTKILCIGEAMREPYHSFNWGYEVIKLIQQKFGIEWNQIGTPKFLNIFENCAEEDGAIIRDGAADDRLSKDFDTSNSVKNFKVYKKLIEEYGANAFTVNCLESTVHTSCHSTSCYALSRLNDEGIVAACEADATTLIDMIITSYASNSPAFMLNPYLFPMDDRLFVSHCTSPRRHSFDSEEKDDYNVYAYFEIRNLPCGLQILKQPGPVTVTGISHDTLDKMVIVRGNLVRNTAFPSCRTQLEIDVPGGIQKLAECYEGRHWALVYGDQSKKIAKANELLGIESMII